MQHLKHAHVGALDARATHDSGTLLRQTRYIAVVTLPCRTAQTTQRSGFYRRAVWVVYGLPCLIAGYRIYIYGHRCQGTYRVQGTGLGAGYKVQARLQRTEYRITVYLGCTSVWNKNIIKWNNFLCCAVHFLGTSFLLYSRREKPCMDRHVWHFNILYRYWGSH